MQHKLTLVVGLLLTSCLAAKAQTFTTQVFLARALPESTPMFVPAPLSHFPPKVSPTSRPSQKPVAQFRPLAIPAYTPDRNLESQSLVEVFRTPFLTESRLVVVQFWGGRLQLDGFESTLYTQNGHLRSPGSGGLLPRASDKAGLASAVGRDGISLVFRFGRDAQTTRQPLVWRGLAWISGG